jgi:hypothetical protein
MSSVQAHDFTLAYTALHRTIPGASTLVTLEDDDEGQARLGLTRDNCAPLTPRLLSKLGVLAAWADIKLLTSL